jgi:hypothetical protein
MSSQTNGLHHYYYQQLCCRIYLIFFLSENMLQEFRTKNPKNDTHKKMWWQIVERFFFSFRYSQILIENQFIESYDICILVHLYSCRWCDSWFTEEVKKNIWKMDFVSRRLFKRWLTLVRKSRFIKRWCLTWNFAAEKWI